MNSPVPTVDVRLSGTGGEFLSAVYVHRHEGAHPLARFNQIHRNSLVCLEARLFHGIGVLAVAEKIAVHGLFALTIFL